MLEIGERIEVARGLGKIGEIVEEQGNLGGCLWRKAICPDPKDVRRGPWPSGANRTEALSKASSR